MSTMETLTPKERRLLAQSLAVFDAAWDEDAGLLVSQEGGARYHGTRESAYCALALLMRGGEGDAARADRILRTVLGLQRLDPGAPWHGTFASSPEQAAPVRGAVDFRRVTPEARYLADVLWTRTEAAFRASVEADPSLSGQTAAVTDLLRGALESQWPVVWDTYDPNWREFILSVFALILERYADRLPAETVRRMDEAARAALEGAVTRVRQGLTPLNTNVQLIHVYVCDRFGARFGDAALTAHAEAYARQIAADYGRMHAAAEFNSPTYNGVVLSFCGLLRSSGSADVRRLGEVLEDGLWHDLADFWNPAMRNLCGPYSRAYELEMTVHTALGMLLYLGLDEVPEEELPPVSVETESACILCLAGVRIPDDVRPLMTASRGERTVTRRFRELAERGDPCLEPALCTATAWITDEMMLGGMSGSRNTSYQLHPAVVFWRNSRGGLSTAKLLRRTADGRLTHLDTVLFDFAASRGCLEGTVRNRCGQPVEVFAEIESPGAADLGAEASFTLDGLAASCLCTVRGADGRERRPDLRAEHVSPTVARLVVPLADGEALALRAEFSLDK